MELTLGILMLWGLRAMSLCQACVLILMLWGFFMRVSIVFLF